MGRLSNKVALITGAGAGIGRETALLFAQEGAKIAFIDKNPSGGAETVKLIKAQGGDCLFIEADVTQAEEVEAAVQSCVKTFGKLNILHNNAGGSTVKDGAVTEGATEEFWRKIQLDLFGTWLGCQYGIPAIIASGGGAVINMTSVVALIGTHRKDAYTAAKGAISALTRSMAVEYGPKNVRINAIAPGATGTDRVLTLLKDDGVTSKFLAGQMFGVVPPKDVAYAALYLASDESLSTTGHILTVDGGLTIN
ncbi:MAG: SDR family oxidoreductase [Alcaligenaceae bacterium]|jgi:NAD(P)-dependent dehydrogenase (short-subunit alcohol dehydrogenase family)